VNDTQRAHSETFPGQVSEARPIRVLMLTFRFHPLGDGTEQQALALSRTLSRRGLSVRVATAKFRGLQSSATVDGIRVDRLPYTPDRRRLRRLAKLPYVLALAAYLSRRRNAFDIVHCHMAGFELIPAVLVAQRLGRPVVVKIACAGPEGDVPRLATGEQPWGALGPLALRMLRRVTAIVAPSRQIQRELTAEGFPRRHYIPNGVDVQRFQPATEDQRVRARRRLGAPADGLVIGFLGRLSRQKGIDVLIRAWSGSALRDTGGALYVAGQGPEEAALRAMASESGPAGRSIHFLGTVEPAEFLHALDIYVLASRFEGMPNSLLEAMASGLPCVGTRIAGTEDLLEDGQSGLLVPSEEVGALQVALDQLRSAGLRHRLGSAARRRVEKEFSLEGIARRYHELYQQLVSSPAGMVASDEAAVTGSLRA